MTLPPLLSVTASGDWLDIAILVIIIGSTLLGVVRGLIQSVAGLLGLILGAVFAGQIAVMIDPALNQANIQHPPITGATAFVIAFVLIVVGVEIAAGFLRVITKMLFLGWLDRVGGAVFGLLRGVILSMILLAGMTMFNSGAFNSSIAQAQSAVYLWQNMSALTGMLPTGMQQSTIKLVTNQLPFLGQPAGQ